MIKFRFMKFISIAFIFLLATSCKSNQADEKKEMPVDTNSTTSLEKIIDDESTEANYHATEDNAFLKVVNERYDFSFEIPKAWKAIDKSNNGDGFYIDCGNKSVDMRVYGENLEGNEIMAEMELKTCVSTEDYKFGDGYPGIKCNQNSDTYYYYDTPQTRIVFYIHADKKWNSENAATVNAIAKSISSGKANFN